MNVEFMNALNEIENEKGIQKEVLIEAIEMALISAYKKHYGNTQNARVDIDGETGEIKVFEVKNIVEEIEDPDTEITLEDAQKADPTYGVGDVYELEVTPKEFGRIAAQTAKQVVVQRIREAERGIIYDKYSEKENDILTATVHRIDRGNVFVEFGKAEGIIPASETVYTEQYTINERLKVYVIEVKKTNKGPQIIVSRTHPFLIKKLFELEVPEIKQGIVQIKSIAREAGQRTKIAVYTDEKDVDPVGACVGHKGMRIERVVDELRGEKIDVVPWSSDPIEFIANSLRPAKVLMVQIKADEKAAKVIVPDYQLSLAIGKEGQNARLAAKLTGWKIDIKSQSQSEEEIFGKMDSDEEAEDTEDIDETEMEEDIEDIEDVEGDENEEDIEDLPAEDIESVTEEELPELDENEIEDVLSEDFDLEDEK
jgi:N utilization substance protein A